MPYKSETLIVRGTQIHVRRAGDGPPLLYLHGAGGVLAWLPFFDNLAKHFELIVPDHPGFGQSEMPTWLRTVNDAAMYYLEFIEALKLETVPIVGHSLGGWIAAQAALFGRDVISKLALIAPAGLRQKGVQTGDIFIWSPEERVRNLYFDQEFADRALKEPPPTPETQEILMKNSLATAKLAWQPRLHNPELERWLHRVTVPTLLVWGDSDKVIPPGIAAAWQSRLKQADLMIVPGCGHVPQVEHEGQVLSRLIPFVRE